MHLGSLADLIHHGGMLVASSRSRRLRIILIVGVSVVAVLVLAALVHMGWQRAKYLEALRKAELAYSSSRKGVTDTESFEFLTGGVTAGMSAEQVDEVFKDADERTPLLRSDSWSGTAKMYRIVYGQWHNPYTGRDDDLIEERFFVYFDQDGRAVRMDHTLFRRSDGLGAPLTIDLQTQKKTPTWPQ